MHLLRQGRLGESNILKEATRKLVLTRVSHFRIIHQMSLNSGMPVADAQLTVQNDVVYLILNNTMAGEHRNQ